MPLYRIVAAVNTAPNHYGGYTPGDSLALVTARPSAVAPILFAIVAVDAEAALEVMWDVGRGVIVDERGRCWPADVRSLSSGDALMVYAPGYPLQSQRVETFAVRSTGFDAVPAPDPLAWVPLAGSNASSRPVAQPTVPYAPPPHRDGGPRGEMLL